MKSLIKFIKEAHERGRRFTSVINASFFASAGIEVKGKSLGDALRAFMDPSEADRVADTDPKNIGGFPVYYKSISSDFSDKMAKDLADDYVGYGDLAFLFTVRGTDENDEPYKDNDSRKVLNRKVGRYRRDYSFNHLKTMFYICYEMKKNMEQGKVAYWSVNCVKECPGKVSNDPGGAAYMENDIANSNIFAFEYIGDNWFKNNDEFEVVWERNITDLNVQKSPVFVCRWFSTLKGAKFWKNWVEGFKPNHKVCIINFEKPSREARKFLDTHTKIKVHKQPMMFGQTINYGLRKGTSYTDDIKMDRLMELVRTYKGTSRKSWDASDTFMDKERETAYKDGDRNTKTVEKTAPPKEIKPDPKAGGCRHIVSNISNIKITMYKGIEISTYLETCDDCGYTSYGCEVGHKEAMEGGYKTRQEALERAKRIVQDMNSGNW